MKIMKNIKNIKNIKNSIFSKKNYVNIILACVCILLLFAIFYWGNYLIKNNYIVECFQQNNNPHINTNNVNLPLTTTYSCSNFCGPTARCSITGQQCIADIDCPGCQPYVPPLSKSKSNIPGENDAGKLTVGITPQFSTLTTDIGTQAKLFNEKALTSPPQPNFGINTWLSPSNKLQKLFDDRYKPPNTVEFMPQYPSRYSVSGLYLDNDPLAANGYITIK